MACAWPCRWPASRRPRRPAPAVSGVRASQRPGTQTLLITYDLAADNTTAVSLEVSDNGGLSFGVPVFHCDGPDYGGAVQPGPGRRMTWDAGKDWPGKLSANVVVRLTARDNSGPVPAPSGMVWIPGGSFQMGSPA